MRPLIYRLVFSLASRWWRRRNATPRIQGTIVLARIVPEDHADHNPYPITLENHEDPYQVRR